MATSRPLLLALACAMTALALVTVALVGGGARADGRERWVDRHHADCTDDQETGPRDRPFCSVRRAAEVAGPGDTVRIAPGRYRGTVRPARGGTRQAPIRFIARGDGVVLDADGAANAVKVVGTNHVRFTGVEITGGANQGVWIEGADGIRLTDVAVVRNGGAGVQIKSGTGTRISGGRLSRNGRAGLLELHEARNTRVTRVRVAANGRDGLPYNGDGIQLGGRGARVSRCTIVGNGDSPFEHGVYTGKNARGWRLDRNVIRRNAGANVKAGGVGRITNNRITDAQWGIVLSDNPRRVLVRQNIIGGSAQHLVFLTKGARPARASLLQNTIVQAGRSTDAGDASAIFVLAADDLVMRNNLVAYAGADAAGVSLWVNDPALLRRVRSDTNWWAATDSGSRHLAHGGVRITLDQWRIRTGQDRRSVTSWAPSVDSRLGVTSTNWGAGRGADLGLKVDILGRHRPKRGGVDIGAHR